MDLAAGACRQLHGQVVSGISTRHACSDKQVSALVAGVEALVSTSIASIRANRGLTVMRSPSHRGNGHPRRIKSSIVRSSWLLRHRSSSVRRAPVTSMTMPSARTSRPSGLRVMRPRTCSQRQSPPAYAAVAHLVALAIAGSAQRLRQLRHVVRVHFTAPLVELWCTNPAGRPMSGRRSASTSAGRLEVEVPRADFGGGEGSLQLGPRALRILGMSPRGVTHEDEQCAEDE